MTQKETKHTEQWGLLKFDPVVLVRDVAKRWILILLVVLLAGMAAYVYETATYEPVYKTSITYVTYNRSDYSAVYGNLTAATTVAGVFEELLNSSLLSKTIMAESGLSSFDGVINAHVISETNLITVIVSGSDPRSVFLMAQAIVDHHEVVTYQVIDNVSLELLRSPSVPMAPSNISDALGLMKKAMVLAAAATILVLGYFSFQRDTVRSSKEAKSKLDCTCIGEVPHERKYRSLSAWLRRNSTSILVTNPLASFRFVEALRKLASRIEHHMCGKKVVMVTSLLENEGKSSVAVNLAMAMALKHEKVLLIDCDLRKPACHKLAGLCEVKYGLRDVLDGKVELPRALIEDKKSGLYMLLETNATKDADHYLGGENMHLLLQWARQNFDMVVLDLPPMALACDAESMMELADSSVLVVRQNMAKAAGINKAIATMQGGKAKLLGCVLNDVYISGLTTGGYGYSYGYGKYSHYSKYGKYGQYGQYGKYSRYGRHGRYWSDKSNHHEE